MRKGPAILVFLSVLVIGGLIVLAQSQKKDCKGRFRWDVKTLTDTFGLDLLNSPVKESAISKIGTGP